MSFSSRELACVGAMIFDDGLRARYTGPPDQFTPRGTPGYQHGAARTRVTEPVSVLVSGPQLLVQSPNPHRRELIVAVRWENIESIKQRPEGPNQCAAARFSISDGAILILEAAGEGPGSGVVIGAILKAIDMISSSRDSADRFNNLANKGAASGSASDPYDNKAHRAHFHSNENPSSSVAAAAGLNDSAAGGRHPHLSSPYQQLREKYNVKSDESSVGGGEGGKKSVSSSRYADDNLADERAIEEIRRREERIRAEIAESRRSASRGASASMAPNNGGGDPDADRRRRAAADRARVHRSSSRTSSVGSTALEVFAGVGATGGQSHHHQKQQDKALNLKLQELASGDAKVKQIQRQMEEDRLKLEAISSDSAEQKKGDAGPSSSTSVTHSQLKMENVRSEIEATLAQLEKDGQNSLHAAEAQRRRTGIEKPAVSVAEPAVETPQHVVPSSPPPVPPPKKLAAPPAVKQMPAPLPLPDNQMEKQDTADQIQEENPSRESVSAEPTPLQQLAEATSPAPPGKGIPPPPVPIKKVPPPPGPPAPKQAPANPTAPAPVKVAPPPPPKVVPVAAPAAAPPAPAPSPNTNTAKKKFKVHKHGEKYYYVEVESKKTMWKLPEDEEVEIVNPEMLPADQQPKNGQQSGGSTSSSEAVVVDEEKLKQIRKELDTVQKNESSTRMQIEDDYRKQSAVKTIEGRESKSLAERAQNDRLEAERKAHKEAERKKQEEAAAARAKADEEAAAQKALEEKETAERLAAEKKKQEDEKAAMEAAAKAEVAAAEAAEKLKKFNDPKRPLRTSGPWAEKRTADNKIYFANSATKGSTWKIEETPFATMDLAEGTSTSSSGSETKVTKFIEKKSPDGKTYYVDVATKQSVWKLPPGAEVVDPASLSTPASPTKLPTSPTAASPTKSEAASGASLPTEPGKKFIEKKSPDGKTYYIDVFTKKSAWKLPDGAEVVDAGSVSSPASPARPNASEATAATEPGKKFIEKKSPDGKTYYIDVATKQSVWKLPDGAEIVDAASLPASPQRAASPAGSATTTAGADGPRFIEKKSPDGKTYYINMATKQSVWKLPEGAVIVPADQAASPPRTSGGGKPRFLAKQAPDGRTYYINMETKQSVWQKPEDAEIVSSP